jgi:hypothetical protein
MPSRLVMPNRLLSDGIANRVDREAGVRSNERPAECVHPHWLRKYLRRSLLEGAREIGDSF